MREGRYDLADFFYKVAYREGVIGHWQQAAPLAEGRGFRVASATRPDPESVGGVEAGNRVMDLHGHSLPLAHAAVRFALEEIWRFSQLNEKTVGDLTIITGVGKGSLHALQPVVRPEVQRMLMDEFYPPIHSATKVGNPGRVVVPAEAIEGWLKHNMEAKRHVMARLAATLKQRAKAREDMSEISGERRLVDDDTIYYSNLEDYGEEFYDDTDW